MTWVDEHTKFSFRAKPAADLGSTKRDRSPVASTMAMVFIAASLGALLAALLAVVPAASTAAQPQVDPTGAIFGVVFEDIDNDWLHGPADRGVAGVSVRVSGAGFSATTQTDSTGAYRFDGLAVDSYTVQVFGPDDRMLVPDHAGQGTDALRDSDVDPDTGRSDVIDLTGGTQVAVNAGFHPPPTTVTLEIATAEPVDDPPSVLVGWAHERDLVLASGESYSRAIPNHRGHWFSVAAPDDGWSIDIECDPDAVVQRTPPLERRQELTLDFAGLAGAEVRCLATLTPSAPVAINYRKVMLDPVGPTIHDVQIGSQHGLVAAGETATTMVPADDIEVVEYPEPGTELVSLECTDGERVVAWDPDADISAGDREARVTFIGLAGGSTLDCESVSRSESTTRATLTLVHESAEGGPAGFPVEFTVLNRRPSSAGVELAVSDRASLAVSTSYPVMIRWEPTVSWRLVDLTCRGALVSQVDLDQREVWVDSFEAGSEVVCTMVTEAGDHRPKQIAVQAVVEGAKQDLPEFDYYVSDPDDDLDARHRWPSDGIVLTAYSNATFWVDLPGDWKAVDLNCAPDVATVVDRRGDLDYDRGSLGASLVRAHVAELDPGAAVACELLLRPVDSIGLTFNVEVLGEPDADIEVPFRIIGTPGLLVATPQTPAMAELSTDRFEALIVPTVLPRLRPVSGSCDTGLQGELQESLKDWHFEMKPNWSPEAPPLRVTCTLVVERVEPALLTVRTEIVGVDGNGSFEIEVAGFDFGTEPVTIDREGTATFEVPIGEIELRQSVPRAWVNVGLECDRDFGVTRTEAGADIEVRPGDEVACTFSNRLISQDVGARGDGNCDGAADIADALAIAQFEVGIRTGATGCPVTDAGAEIYADGADFNGDGSTNIADALAIARCIVGYDDPLCTDPG